ncbi:hypothetical protein HYT95_03615, partial [Candidatus Peregrinibacteria bacterium]|nr:hypothetical protein [Candidatus Peregrinibacteria bacterium]
YSLGTIAGTLFLTQIIGPYGPIAGTAAGSGMYALWRLWAIWRLGIPLRLRLWHPAVAEMGWMAIPRMVALGTLQVRLLILDTLASFLPTGAITINAYARNMQSVVVGAIGIALAQAIFSPMSRAAARKDGEHFRRYIRQGSLFMLLLTVPSAAFLFFIPGTVAIVAIALSWSLLGTYGLSAIPMGFIAGHAVQLVILWWNLPTSPPSPTAVGEGSWERVM